MVGGKCLIPWRAPPCVGRGQHGTCKKLAGAAAAAVAAAAVAAENKATRPCRTGKHLFFPYALPLASAGVGGYIHTIHIYIYIHYIYIYTTYIYIYLVYHTYYFEQLTFVLRTRPSMPQAQCLTVGKDVNKDVNWDHH